jgi:hypothetical protein
MVTANYNHDLCDHKHKEIDSRLEKGEAKMNALSEAIHGNGKPGLNGRVDKIELILQRQESLMWRILQPALPVIYGLLLAGLYAKYGT